MTAFTGRYARMAILPLGAALLSMLGACAPSGQATLAPASPTAAAAASTPASTVAPATAGPAASQGPACVPPPAGMVAWWRAEGDAHDALGTHDGALQGGATFAAGKVGRAFAFDGATQFVSVPGSPALQPQTAITLEGWVYAKGAPSGYAGIAGTWDDNTGANRTYLFWVQGQELEFLVSPDHNGFQRVTDPTPFPPDAWVHVAGTYDGTMLRLYRDGIEIASAATSGPIAVNDKAFLIGRTEGGSVGPNFWKGSIDEISVYNRALTAGEIALIHTAGSAGKCQA